jgi:hypothetical protein
MATEQEVGGSTPAYLLASNIHTSLNGGNKSSFLEDVVGIVAKGVPTTLIAAGTEISNIPATVGNMFMGDKTFELNKARDIMADIDSDLAKYYDDHKLGIDTAGFVVGSFVPGMAGTKVLRAGQGVVRNAFMSGRMGHLTADALGIVPPLRETYIAAAVKQIGSTGNAFALGESNLLRAFAAGFGQQALEGAAWTAMVNATMNQSPILDQRDTSDLMWDVVTGAALGGVVGGLFEGTTAAFKVKAAFNAAEKEVFPWTIKGLGGTPVESLSLSDKILYKLQQLDALPAQDPANELARRIGTTAAKTQSTLQMEIRALAGELAGGDQDVANLVIRNLEGNDFNKNLSNWLESRKVGRITSTSKIEKEAETLLKDINKKFPDGGLSIDQNDPLVKELNKIRVSYANTMTGEVSADVPKLLNLADKARPEVVRNVVKVGTQSYKQEAVASVKELNGLEAEARYLWAEKSPAFNLPEDRTFFVLGNEDIPLMQKALREGFYDKVRINNRAFGSTQELDDFIKLRQSTIAAELKETTKKSNDEIAKIVNADEQVLMGEVDNAALWNKRQHTRDTYTKQLGDDPLLLPSFVKIVTKSEGAVDATTGHVLEGMAIVAQKEKLYKQAADRIAAEGLREILPDSAGLANKAVGSSTGAGFVTSESGNYGSQSSFWAYVGQRIHNVIRERRDATREVFTPMLQKLANSMDEAIEWSVLNEKMRGLPGRYKLSPEGDALVYSLDDMTEEAIEELASKGIPERIEINSPLVQELVAEHIATNTQRRKMLQRVHSNNGYPDKVDVDTFYPIPRNVKDTPFFAFVVDDTVSGTGHSKMIYAKDAETLDNMRNEIMSDPELRGKGLRVLTKTESEEYYKSIGQYEFERTLNENYINTALARKGKSQSFLPTTDPQKIVNDFLEWHLQRDSSLVRTITEHKYAQDFATLRQYASGALEASKSKFGYISPLSYAENTAKSPAADLIKMALDITKADEYPLWTPLNKFLDGAFSNLTDKISKTFGAATSPAHLDQINSALKNAGYNDVIVDSALYEAMNGKIARGTLSSIVNKANAIIATFALRSDPFNALNNAVGSSVLLGAETKAVLRAIEAGNANAVGELAQLMKVKVPGTESLQLSPAKLIAKQLAEYSPSSPKVAWGKQHGFISSITDQYDQTLDTIGLAISRGDESLIQKAMTTAKSLGDKAEKWTANKLAEEMNRFVAAGVMKDITDIAVKNGIMTEQTALSYINTFVNRTQGNYLASQRPVLFQGPLGQAMGLFQTYQFNMLQQVFRHVGEGSKKDLAVMMGLQGGIYGMNGLPAFNAINTYVIGAAGGNPENRTLYDAVLSGAGKDAGEWLLYGGLSNGLSLFHPDLKTNIYSRGDINPRHVTLIPLDPSKTPIYQATERMLKNTFEGMNQVAMGADVWGTFLRGVEQNGISRPLAGMAQILEAAGRPDKKVVSSNQQGNMLMAHDLYSLSSLMRVAGAKPLDEAIVNDQMFRVNTWRSKDADKRKQLAEGIKTSILNGNVPDAEQIGEFADSYARYGGKQSEFAAFMANQYTKVSVSQAEELRRNISSPYSKSMQLIMNGGEQ